MMRPDDFCGGRNHRAPSWVIHQQSTNAATDPALIGVPFGMFDETIFVFHMMCPDDFCRPQPPRTVMGHPPTINQCRATDPATSIGVPFGMFDETLFVYI
jgi:hypothetical protein